MAQLISPLIDQEPSSTVAGLAASGMKLYSKLP
jgi:phytoene dehydrogenase-like protein